MSEFSTFPSFQIALSFDSRCKPQPCTMKRIRSPAPPCFRPVPQHLKHWIDCPSLLIHRVIRDVFSPLTNLVPECSDLFSKSLFFEFLCAQVHAMKMILTPFPLYSPPLPSPSRWRRRQRGRRGPSWRSQRPSSFAPSPSAFASDVASGSVGPSGATWGDTGEGILAR